MADKYVLVPAGVMLVSYVTGTTMLRRIGNKRARKLRRKGVRVWWCPKRESYVWEMPP